MKIQKIKIAQFKILKNLEKEINGKNIFLVGENGVGKSSIMHSGDSQQQDDKNAVYYHDFR